MRTGLIALGLACALSACAGAPLANGPEAPLGRGLELRLPPKPGYPGAYTGVQTVVGEYGGRRAAFEAVLELSPDVASIALTTVGGPRILSVRWSSAGIVEDRTPLAPPELKGISVLADIFLSLWPVEAVQAAAPAGVEITEAGALRRVAAAGRTIVEVETLQRSDASMRQELRHSDFGYTLRITTEPATRGPAP
ncbi:MAG: DUF3261 domain-containing protein [Alphaproteobacteria bacterium]|nr:DUF3261 domain-containing protein [Alphaproteobacteria bacterium]